MIIKNDLFGDLIALTPFDTTFNASISKPESVSSIITKFGSSRDICKISFLFFSPPEKPTFNGRDNISLSIFNFCDFSFTKFKNSTALISFSPLDFFTAFIEVLKKLFVKTPGISIGYWKAKKIPFCALSSVFKSNIFFPL